MVGNAPTSGTKKPAPADNRTSPIGNVKPVGAPFMFGSCENEYCVFAMHTGKLPKPCFVNRAIFSFACSENSTAPAL